ncbi:MAG: topoisomerase protein, partial [Candidatus Nomurabacteria bacterium GW2011_GWA1_46_11]
MSNLVIVESPTKAKTLTRFLGGGYIVEATMGHLRDLPEKKIGIDVKNNFAPTYEVIAKKKDSLAKIKKLAESAEKIYLATDPDREGEAIAWHVKELLRSSNVKNQKSKNKNEAETNFKRIAFHEITETAIRDALASPHEIDMPLVDAQQARRALDRLVGYKLSPLLWRKVKRGLSAGRVQSVAVKIIVEREREIQSFQAVEYWEIFVDLQKIIGPDEPSLTAKLTEINGVKANIKDKTQADPVITKLNAAAYKVFSLDSRDSYRTPPPPFTTSLLQQNAANRFGWTAKKTMQLAQSLYEQGLITYHRTDSTNLSEQAIKMVRDYILATYSQDYLPETPRLYKTKSKVAQEAHEAIRPTDIAQNVPASLGRDETKLYDLVWKRFTACQMNPAKFLETTVKVAASCDRDNFLLETKGSVPVFDGWLKLYGAGFKENIGTEEEQAPQQKLPALAVGDLLKLLKLNPFQKFTQPPNRYTEATLIKKLEELSIGRPSTYAPILTTIQGRQYVERVDPKTGLPPGRALKPTTLGMAVNDFLIQYFSNIVDYQFTARMEENLDEIANGQKQWIPVIREFYDPFEKQLAGVGDVQKVKIELEETGEMCPECKEGKLVIRLGRFGKFISCSRFPDCKYRAPLVQKVQGLKCPTDGGEIVLRKTKKGKIFYGCVNWPKCKWASWTKPKVAAEIDPTKPKTTIDTDLAHPGESTSKT